MFLEERNRMPLQQPRGCCSKGYKARLYGKATFMGCGPLGLQASSNVHIWLPWPAQPTSPALKLGSQAKQTIPGSPAMPGGQMRPCPKCSETSLFGC
eukprot:scaffold45930_cov16-Tisochrysis_lutea.AAC.1